MPLALSSELNVSASGNRLLPVMNYLFLAAFFLAGFFFA